MPTRQAVTQRPCSAARIDPVHLHQQNPVTKDFTKRNEKPGSKKKGEFMDVKSDGKKFKRR